MDDAMERLVQAYIALVDAIKEALLTDEVQAFLRAAEDLSAGIDVGEFEVPPRETLRPPGEIGRPCPGHVQRRPVNIRNHTRRYRK